MKRKFPVAISLDFQTLDAVDRLAADRGRSRSAVVRDLIFEAVRDTGEGDRSRGLEKRG